MLEGSIMPSLTVRVFLLLSAALASWLLVPCYAGWGSRLARILPGVVKRAAVSLIEREIYDVEQTDQKPYDSQSRSYQTDENAYGNSANGANWKNRDPNGLKRWGDVPHFGLNVPHAQASGAAHRQTVTGQIGQESAKLRYLPTDSERDTIACDDEAASAFSHGAAGNYSFDRLIKAHVFVLDPLVGSVFKRHTAVKYIILHSTETGSPANAPRVIKSWNNRGMRHPGAQFVVDRDGIIYSTTDPDMATVHINTSKTLPGYTNDNSIGIEIVRAGPQKYTQPQLDSVMYLVSYLQGHYHVVDTNVTTHHHVQPSDRSDPVGFDLLAFQQAKVEFGATAIASTSSEFADRKDGLNRNPSPALSMARKAAHRVNSPRIQTVSQIPKPAPDFRSFHPSSR
jgi:hypothetical protein